MSEHHFEPAVLKAVAASRTAVNVITYFLLLLAVFAGVMLGIFNGAAENATNWDFAMGFAVIFFGISLPALIFNKLVKDAIAHPESWKQALVWFYCLLLLPLFPIGTGAAIVILYGQVQWMRAP